MAVDIMTGSLIKILDSVPADEHDKKVDTIVTEKDIL